VIKLARILQIDAEKVELHLEQNSSCTDCTSGCSDSFMSFLFPKSAVIYVSKNKNLITQTHLNDGAGFFTQEYQQGDVVGMKFSERQLFRLALVLYGLPIILIVITLIVFYYLFSIIGLNSDFGGFFGLILGLVFSKTILKFNHKKFKPQVEFFK